jgi:acetylornithine deacetylase/succinyl-diaminopimelate desuccinylase-like protein
MHSQFSAELRLLQDRVDNSTLQIRELSAQQKALSTTFETAQASYRARQERKQRIQNLRRAVHDMRERLGVSSANGAPSPTILNVGDADAEFSVPEPSSQQAVNALPDSATLNARLSTYKSLNASLAAHLTSLKARDTELESKYRKVVALCTNVPEAKVDTVLQQLVLAVESEPENDVGRVREFLKRVEAVTGAG